MVTHISLFQDLASDIGGRILCRLRQLHIDHNCVQECFYPAVFREVKVYAGQNMRIIDAVALVHSNLPRVPATFEFSVAIEFKDTRDDLVKDDKYLDYLGYTDYFFFGVPGYLVRDALRKASKQKYVGVINFDDGRIIKMAIRQQVPEKNRRTIFYRAFIKSQ